MITYRQCILHLRAGIGEVDHDGRKVVGGAEASNLTRLCLEEGDEELQDALR